MDTRKAFAAGRFYPDNKPGLIKQLDECFYDAQKFKLNSSLPLKSIIVPHAGYVFSGAVAAGAFQNIDTKIPPQNIFIIAPSHQYNLNSAAICNYNSYETPLGQVIINTDICNNLVNNNNCFILHNQSHNNEHSIETQLPFLQYLLNKPFKIIPILLATNNQQILQQVAKTLYPYFTNNNLFVFSTDFSHYPAYPDAIDADNIMANAILQQSVTALIKANKKIEQLHYKGLVTSACGLSGLMVLMHMLQQNKTHVVEKIMYQNSGNSPYGDKQSVVGYWSFAVLQKKIQNNNFELTDNEKQTLLSIAKQSIINNINDVNNKNIFADKTITENLNQNLGAFVSVYINNNLRGCLGSFEPTTPLYQTIQNLAISASQNDYRFLPVTKTELNNLKTEISVLGPLTKIDNINQIIIGKHGIVIKKGNNSGTLLPQVATNNGFNTIQFIECCSANKAGLGRDGWKQADIFIYTATVFEN